MKKRLGRLIGIVCVVIASCAHGGDGNTTTLEAYGGKAFYKTFSPRIKALVLEEE